MEILKVENLSKSYSKNKVLKNVSLTINGPSIVALVGPNGSGKTTFLNCIANILNSDSGKVTILGKSNKDVSVYFKYSYMIDNTVLYDYLTGLDHLKFVCETHKLTKDAIRKAVELMGIKSFINKKIKEYSLGMKQQLLFAMSILNEPEFLVLDEPFNGLDPSTIIKVRKIMIDMMEKGTTILLSSHNLGEVDQMTSHIVFVKDGNLLEEDISKYQEDVYYFTVKDIDAFKDREDYTFKGQEIIVKLKDKSLSNVLGDIGNISEILKISKETVGSEKRYKELYEEML